MSYTVIDKKSEPHNYGSWPVTENVTTTLTLLNMGNGKIGVNYDSDFSGVKSGHVQGGPIEVNSDKTAIVNDSPRVAVIVSQFNKSQDYVSMHITITVDIPVIGTETLYSQTLGGHYDDITGWAVAISNINIKEQNT